MQIFYCKYCRGHTDIKKLFFVRLKFKLNLRGNTRPTSSLLWAVSPLSATLSAGCQWPPAAPFFLGIWLKSVCTGGPGRGASHMGNEGFFPPSFQWQQPVALTGRRAQETGPLCSRRDPICVRFVLESCPKGPDSSQVPAKTTSHIPHLSLPASEIRFTIISQESLSQALF